MEKVLQTACMKRLILAGEYYMLKNESSRFISIKKKQKASMSQKQSIKTSLPGYIQHQKETLGVLEVKYKGLNAEKVDCKDVLEKAVAMEDKNAARNFILGEFDGKLKKFFENEKKIGKKY